MDNPTTEQTQPQEKTTQEIYELVADIQKTINDMTILIRTEDDIRGIFKEELTSRDTEKRLSHLIQKEVSLFVAGITRGIDDIKSSIGDIKQFTQVKFTEHESKININMDEIGIIKLTVNGFRENLASVKANQEQMLHMMERTDNAIHGKDGNGLVSKQAITSLQVEKMAVDQNLMRKDLHELTQIARDNARLHNEQLNRENKREADRKAFYASLKESAWFVASRGAAWALGTGAVGTALVAIGHALIGS